jgi:hypothetical protein
MTPVVLRVTGINPSAILDICVPYEVHCTVDGTHERRTQEAAGEVLPIVHRK